MRGSQARHSCWFGLNTIVQYYNADANSNYIRAQWHELETNLEKVQLWFSISGAALCGSMALSHFLCYFCSNSLVQPTSLYSSVNSGKKALISFLPPRLGPRRVYEKPSLEANAQHHVPSMARRTIVSSVYVSKPCCLSQTASSASWTLSWTGQILPDILQFVCLGGIANISVIV